MTNLYLYKKLASILVLPGIFLIIFFWVGFFATIHFEPHHDGVLFKPAMDVVQGKMLFRDSFTQYGALTTLIQAVFLKLFGATLIVMKLSSVLFYALTAVLLYLVWKRLFSRATIFFSFVVWMFFSYFYHSGYLAWSSVYAFFFQTLALLMFFLFLERKSWIWLAFTGMSTALVFWCKQPVGIFMAASFLLSLFLVVTKKIEVLSVTTKWFVFAFLGGIGVSLPFIFWLIFNGALTDWWKQSFILSMKFTGIANATFSGGSPIGALFPGIFSYRQFFVWSFIPLSFLYYTYRKWAQRSKNKEKAIMELSFGSAALFSWLQYYPVSDPLHWHWATTPFIVLFVWAMYDGPRQIVSFISDRIFALSTRVQEKATLVLVLLAIFGVGFIGRSAVETVFKAIDKKGNGAYTTLSQPSFLIGTRVDQTEKANATVFLTFLKQYFDSHPEKQYINMSNDGLYAFFVPSHYRDFHRMWVGWEWATNAVYPEYSSIAEANIAKYKPIILLSTPQSRQNYCVQHFSFVQDVYAATPTESLVKPSWLGTRILSLKILDPYVRISEINASDGENTVHILSFIQSGGTDVRRFLIPSLLSKKEFTILFNDGTYGVCSLHITKKKS